MVKTSFGQILSFEQSKREVLITVVYGTLPHTATRPSKTYSLAIPLPVCHQGPLNGYRTGFKKCSDAQQIYSANSCRWHKCKSGWSLKTEKIPCQWHVYIDTTHTIRHLFLTWTSLYPFTFLKLKLNISGSPLAFLWLLTCNTIWTVLRHTSAPIKI